MIEYTRQLKMNMNPHSKTITHSTKREELENFTMDNFAIKEDRFEKYLPYSWDGGYMLVTKSKVEYEAKLAHLKRNIIFFQILLLGLFACISYFLAKKALKPMQEAIERLDVFAKDLIHDLNTPVTSILLNVKILQEQVEGKENKALTRLRKSSEDIAALHKNLSYLLNEEGMHLSKESVFEIVEEALEPYKKLYPKLNFYIEHSHFEAVVNKEAFKQILRNLITNACKYNKEDGYVKIYKKENTLCIEDSGVGIKNPKEVFSRSYTEGRGGHGIGLDIVQRLSAAMNIKIVVVSKEDEGSCFSLEFLK